jgi:hypothetical protein
MIKVKLEVVLEIDSENEDEIENIISNLDYEFSSVVMEEGIGKQLYEKELILDQEIRNHEIL